MIIFISTRIKVKMKFFVQFPKEVGRRGPCVSFTWKHNFFVQSFLLSWFFIESGIHSGKSKIDTCASSQKNNSSFSVIFRFKRLFQFVFITSGSFSNFINQSHKSRWFSRRLFNSFFPAHGQNQQPPPYLKNYTIFALVSYHEAFFQLFTACVSMLWLHHKPLS